MADENFSQQSQPQRNTWGFELGRFVNIPNLGLAVIVALTTTWFSNRDTQQQHAFDLRMIRQTQESQGMQLKQAVDAGAANAGKLEVMQNSMNFMQKQLDELNKERFERRQR